MNPAATRDDAAADIAFQKRQSTPTPRDALLFRDDQLARPIVGAVVVLIGIAAISL